ncbi:hypothetical protein FJ976_02855 [Mesorhizobium sp. B1-1-9]|uniref:hypothetical protein n=1 Tax=Mesorhizobium sp. B1-1-9 TaxID=2589975 RepID=UPI0011260DD0|nr:hypothetical protein [Mesorhizobium sp. B1-1-9]TPN57594.1 hypothetical protein FJ976_02855 [Mesorhizobium sp. B1-1-9]
MHALKMEKPAASKATGFQIFDMLPGKIESLEDTHNRRLLQANRLRERFDLSWPLARVVAEHAFGIGGAV